MSARAQAQQKGNFLPFKYAANVLITRMHSLWPRSKYGRCIEPVEDSSPFLAVNSRKRCQGWF